MQELGWTEGRNCGWTFALLPSIVSFRPNVLGRWSVQSAAMAYAPHRQIAAIIATSSLVVTRCVLRSMSILTIFSFDQVVMPIVVRLCFAASRPVATERPLLAIASLDCCIASKEERARYHH